MFFNDILITVVITFIISFISIIALIIATLYFVFFYKRNHNSKLLVPYFVILGITLFGIYMSVPWLFLNSAFHEKDNATTLKKYNMALNTAVFPKVKATVYDFISSHYNLIEKNLPLAIENCEKHNQLRGDLPEGCILWNLYTIHKNYDKAIAELQKKNLPQFLSTVYFLKGEPEMAIETINKKINTNPKAWDYAYRGNYYSYIGKTELAKNDFEQAIKLMPSLSNHPKFKLMQSNKNYLFDFYNSSLEKYKVK